MLVKSRSLLPMIELSEEEEESIDDLQARLEKYARFKELAGVLKDIFGKNIIFEKTPSKSSLVVFSPDSKTDTENLLAALNSVLDSLPKAEPVARATVRKVASLEETIEKLAQRISGASRVGFREFYGKELGASGELTHENKVSIIVGFLAMLELVRRGAIRVTQEAGGEIEMAAISESE
jgi:chromatin segregation and condensation protein Rec8/ScpA/Scc1 (kleisin family)